MTDHPLSIYIGWDPREAAAFAVARSSAKRRMALQCVPVRGLVLNHLRRDGLYRREMQTRQGPTGAPILWDPISDAPMSTEFAISRFAVPFLAKRCGWAMFIDCDVLVLGNLNRIFEGLDPTKALYCVKRPEMAIADEVKMDGQLQVPYIRKNWSSVMIFNCSHPANLRLTLDMVNTLPGRDLHRLCWLNDDEIGELDPSWNYLVDIDPVPQGGPKIAHFTLGVPSIEGHDGCSFSNEWWQELNSWASSC